MRGVGACWWGQGAGVRVLGRGCWVQRELMARLKIYTCSTPQAMAARPPSQTQSVTCPWVPGFRSSYCGRLFLRIIQLHWGCLACLHTCPLPLPVWFQISCKGMLMPSFVCAPSPCHVWPLIGCDTRSCPWSCVRPAHCPMQISCDACGISVHQSCYGVPDLPGPNEIWMCRACELKDKVCRAGLFMGRQECTPELHPMLALHQHGCIC